MFWNVNVSIPLISLPQWFLSGGKATTWGEKCRLSVSVWQIWWTAINASLELHLFTSEYSARPPVYFNKRARLPGTIIWHLEMAASHATFSLFTVKKKHNPHHGHRWIRRESKHSSLLSAPNISPVLTLVCKERCGNEALLFPSTFSIQCALQSSSHHPSKVGHWISL